MAAQSCCDIARRKISETKRVSSNQHKMANEAFTISQ